MKKIFLAFFSFLSAGTLFFGTAFADAEDPFGTDPASGIHGTVKSDLSTTITSFINYFLAFLGLLSVTMLIYSGVLMVTAQGDEKQIEKAKKIILWSVIGILVIMLSFVIVTTITGA